MPTKTEIQEQVESSFKSYDCKVEFLTTKRPFYWEELGIQVSDKNGKLLPFTRKAPRAAVEDILDRLIKEWRELAAEEKGYQLDPL